MNTSYTMRDNRAGSAARLHTSVAERFEEKELHVTFVAETDSHTPKYTEYNAPLWEGDIVEILLALGDDRTYLEVEANELGALYVVKIVNRDGEGDIAIEPLPRGLVEAKVSIDGKFWRTDVVIFLDKLRALGYNESNRKRNYLRQNYRGEELELFSVSPTMCGSFHKTGAFFDAE